MRDHGHDLFVLSEHPDLDGAPDERVLELAASTGRILITHNVRDFVPLLVAWGGSERSHAGCVLVRGIDHSQVSLLLRGLRALFAKHPDQSGWVDLSLWLTHSVGD